MRKPILLLLALLLVVAGAACGDDDDADDAGSAGQDRDEDTTTTTTSTTALALEPDEIDAEASPYCGAWAEIRAAGGPEGQDAEAVKQHYGELVPLVERLVQAADDDIRGDAETALRLTREVADSGSLERWNTPEAQQLSERLGVYAREHCLKR